MFSRILSKDKSTHAQKEKSKLQRCLQRFLDMNASLFFAAESNGKDQRIPDAKILLATRNRLRKRFEELLELSEGESVVSSSRDRVQTIVSTSAFLDQLLTISIFTHRRCQEAWRNSSFADRPRLEIAYAHTHIAMSDIASCAARKICAIQCGDEKSRNGKTAQRLRVARRHLLRTCRLYCQWLSADSTSRISPNIFSPDRDVSNKNVASLVDSMYDSQAQWWSSLCNLTNVLLESLDYTLELSSSDRTTMSTDDDDEDDDNRKWTFHNLTLLDREINVEDHTLVTAPSSSTKSDILATCILRIRDPHAKEIVKFAEMLTNSSIKNVPRKLYLWRTKSGSPRLTSKLSLNPEQKLTESRKRKLEIMCSEADENKRPRLVVQSGNVSASTPLKRARRVVHENENTEKLLRKICDANPNDAIYRAAHEHAKKNLSASNFDLCQLESLRRTNSAP